ncbi:hypothetical protein ACFL6S_00795 [Candidatus Poribacteria bacterium]
MLPFLLLILGAAVVTAHGYGHNAGGCKQCNRPLKSTSYIAYEEEGAELPDDHYNGYCPVCLVLRNPKVYDWGNKPMNFLDYYPKPPEDMMMEIAKRYGFVSVEEMRRDAYRRKSA